MTNKPAATRQPWKNRTAMALALIVLMVLALAGIFNWNRPLHEQATTSGQAMLDIRGRMVTIDRPVKRIAIDDSRYLVALGLIHPDPVSLLAAWPQDTNRLGTETYQQLLEKSPRLASLPKIASSAGSFNLEALLAANPDLAVLSLESGVTDAQIAQMEAAGIPVILVDFFANPFDHLDKSLTLLGKVIDREAQTEEFLRFRRTRMKLIAERISELPPDDRPTVFLEPHAGMSNDCCSSPGRGNIGDYLNYVGGHNIGADVIRQPYGKLNLEYVISRDPYVYIATGGPHLSKSDGLVLGAKYNEAQAENSLRKVVARRGIAGLSAVKASRAHGISHQLINSPLDIIAIEVFAKWIHPEAFADLDPNDTLAQVNERFLAVPYEGVYWVDLK